MRIVSFNFLRTVLGLLAAAPVTAMAQGALSNQGFGYPLGQLSAASLGNGGAGAEADPNSALNPAALTQTTRFSLSLQFEPEFRTTNVGAQTADATIVRFPSFQATGSFGRWTGSAGVTTLLDRSWVNAYEDSLQIGGEWVPSQIETSSQGAMSDARVAVGYILSQRIQVGLALHGIAGENRTQFSRVFPDTSGIGGLQQSASFGFGGAAVSFGIVSQPTDGLVIAGSMRRGGQMTLEQAGSQVSEATVPTRFGVGVSWLAIPGASFSLRADRTLWTDMDGLGTDEVSLFDATELAFGVDVLGPRIFGGNSVVRAGIRDRTLPFGVLGDQVGERAFTFGAGIPVARGRAQFDIAVQRATREVRDFTERGWFVSLGLGIRP
jgi:hypothetical protein